LHGGEQTASVVGVAVLTSILQSFIAQIVTGAHIVSLVAVAAALVNSSRTLATPATNDS
jgi:hypothetical protein